MLSCHGEGERLRNLRLSFVRWKTNLQARKMSQRRPVASSRRVIRMTSPKLVLGRYPQSRL